LNHSMIALVSIALLAVNVDIPKTWAADAGIRLPPRQMTWEADKVVIDLHSDILVASRPVIKQGEWTVIGDRARLDWVNQDNKRVIPQRSVKVPRRCRTQFTAIQTKWTSILRAV